MVTVKERLVTMDQEQPAGRLTEKVERDLAEALTEFGARKEEIAPERACRMSPPTLVYGVPMAGVRYYSFAPET